MNKPVYSTLLKWILPAMCLAVTACATSSETGAPLPASASPATSSPHVSVPKLTTLPTLPPTFVPSQAVTSPQSEQDVSPAVNFRYQSPPGYEKVEKPGQVSLYNPDKGVFIFFIVMVDDHQSYTNLEDHLQSFMDNPSSDYNVFNPGKCYPYRVSGVEGRACDFSGERKTVPMTGRMILAYPSQNTYVFVLAFAFDGADASGWKVNGLPDSDKLLSSLTVWEEPSK
jgi:hypothetical protein